MGADLLAYYNTLSIKCQTKIYVTNIQQTNTRILLHFGMSFKRILHLHARMDQKNHMCLPERQIT
mgnify:CR=1 FL=1